MGAMPPQLKPDVELVIIEFIRQQLEESQARGLIVGLSGGVDSALVTKLCVMAVGADKVINVFMPSNSTPEVDREHVRGLSKGFGTELMELDIMPMVDAYAKSMPSLDRKELRGNVMARVRMTVLFHYARMMNLLVMGTGNKSELLMGYFTKFGDGGCDFLPIGDLYKTEVWELAKRLDLPPFVIDKAPSAGLWAGQTDEEEMGISYGKLDQVLVGIEQSLSSSEISKRTGIELAKVDMVISKHMASVHKRKMPMIPKIGLRTIGIDWRE
jgi:NAD+ synthase